MNNKKKKKKPTPTSEFEASTTCTSDLASVPVFSKDILTKRLPKKHSPQQKLSK
jgi:hypothetical protein